MATMIRSTTVGTLKSYRSNLNKSFLKQNQARDTVLSQRNFNSCAEDPAAAAQAFQLRRSRMNVESQYDVADSTYRKYQSAWGALLTVVDDVDNQMKNSVKQATLEALSDTTGNARRALGKELSELADTIVQTMNNKYGESFIFSGADGDNVPFTWEGETLCYRGVPVDASVPEVLTVTDNAGQAQKLALKLDADGKYDPANGTETYFTAKGAALVEYDAANPTDAPENVLTDAAGNPVVLNSKGEPATTAEMNGGDTCYYVTVQKDGGTITPDEYAKAEEDVAKLDYLSRESYYVDIGLGFKENESNELIKSSGFNAALNGINFLGYGTDADGDPKNIVSIVKQMAKICSEDTNSFNWDEFDRLAGKMESAASDLHTMHDDMDAATNKLKNNMGLLEDSFYTLQEQYSGLEDVDMADSITSFVWAQYCYNAALKVGNSILSQSLMDYMN